jgi:DNA-binding response OmpR family regulator
MRVSTELNLYGGDVSSRGGEVLMNVEDLTAEVHEDVGLLIMSSISGGAVRYHTTMKAMRFLALAIKRNGLPITKEYLKLHLWGETVIANGLLAGEATKLRKFLRRCNLDVIIHAVPRIGYWMELSIMSDSFR